MDLPDRPGFDDFQEASGSSMIERTMTWLARAWQTPWYCNNKDRSCTYRRRCPACLENADSL
jgi:hypothetical protein